MDLGLEKRICFLNPSNIEACNNLMLPPGVSIGVFEAQIEAEGTWAWDIYL